MDENRTKEDQFLFLIMSYHHDLPIISVVQAQQQQPAGILSSSSCHTQQCPSSVLSPQQHRHHRRRHHREKMDTTTEVCNPCTTTPTGPILTSVNRACTANAGNIHPSNIESPWARSAIFFLWSTMFMLLAFGLYAYVHKGSFAGLVFIRSSWRGNVFTDDVIQKEPSPLEQLFAGPPRAMLLIEDIQSKTGELSAHVLRYHGAYDGKQPYNVRLVTTLDATQFNSIEQFYEASILAIRQEYMPGYHILYITGAINRADMVIRAIATKIPPNDDALLTSQVITERDLALLHWIGAQDQARGDGIIRFDEDGSAYVAFATSNGHQNINTMTAGSGGGGGGGSGTQHGIPSWEELKHHQQQQYFTGPPTATPTQHQVYAMYARTQMDLTGYLGTPLAAGIQLQNLLTDTNAVCIAHRAYNFDQCVSAYMETIPAAQVGPHTSTTTTTAISSAQATRSQTYQIDVHGNMRSALASMDDKLFAGAWSRGAALSLDEMAARARVKCAHIDDDDTLLLGICHDAAKFYASTRQGLGISTEAKLVMGRLPNTTWIQGASIVHLQGESSMQLQQNLTV